MIGPLDRAGEFSAMLVTGDATPQNAWIEPKIFPTQELPAVTDKAEIATIAKPTTMKRIKDRFFDISVIPVITRGEQTSTLTSNSGRRYKKNRLFLRPARF